MEKLKGIANLVDLEKVLRGEEYEGSYDNCSIYYVTEPIECILIDPDRLRPFRKATEITLSLILNDVKLLELIINLKRKRY